jgi:hypothetical protein
MGKRLLKHVSALAVLVALAGAAPGARAQCYTPPPTCSPYHPQGAAPSTTPAPPTPQTPQGRETPSTPSAPTAAPTDQAAGFTSPASSAGFGETVAVNMQGNQLGFPTLVFVPSPSAPNRGLNATGVLVPSVRGFRISEDESPAPQDRVYFGFNFFENVGRSVSERLGLPIHDVRVYRYTFGLEKTCLDGDVSVGLRVPVDTLSSKSVFSNLNGDNTDWGDLTVILKAALLRDCQSGSLISAGLAVTAPTGPSGFAGSSFTVFRDTVLQPFGGYIWNAGNCFVHGFTAVDVPTDSRDVTYFFNDIGVGYHLRRGCGCGDRRITDIIPTVELHLSDPLNHRGAFRVSDPAGTADILDLTAGVTLEFNRRCTLALGVVTPLTGPKPFDYELLAQFNFRFGGGRAAAFQ